MSFEKKEEDLFIREILNVERNREIIFVILVILDSESS